MDSSGGRITGARSGEFTAEAVLRANFFGALDAGAVEGEIGSFRDGSGRSLAGWQVTLNSARLTPGSDSFAGGDRGSVGSDTSGTGSWEGRFQIERSWLRGRGGAADKNTMEPSVAANGYAGVVLL